MVIWIIFNSVPYLWIVWTVLNTNFLLILYIQVPLSQALALKGQRPPSSFHHHHKAPQSNMRVDSEPSTTKGSDLSKSAASGTLGRIGSKWSRKHWRKAIPSRLLTRITEAEEDNPGFTNIDGVLGPTSSNHEQ